ncbi:MAG: hypothetical protein WC455_29755 [Dehalococcoidia bacterium]|jgi:hypothetical protein
MDTEKQDLIRYTAITAAMTGWLERLSEPEHPNATEIILRGLIKYTATAENLDDAETGLNSILKITDRIGDGSGDRIRENVNKYHAVTAELLGGTE